MASVDLEDLVPDIVINLTLPGDDTTYATVTTGEWVNRLRDGFWSAHIDGLLDGWTESDGIVQKLNDPTADAMTRDYQQLVILYTAINVASNRLLQMDTLFRAKAGPVEYETQKSAQVLRAVLEELTGRRNAIIERLVAAGQVTRGIVYIDSYSARQEAIRYGDVEWVGSL